MQKLRPNNHFECEALRNELGVRVNELGFTFNEVFEQIDKSLQESRVKLKMVRQERQKDFFTNNKF